MTLLYSVIPTNLHVVILKETGLLQMEQKWVVIVIVCEEFGRTRGPHVVRLKRSSDGTPPEGVYKCVVRDTRSINQAVYVGIYSGM